MRMVVARAPGRVSLAGGGTDVPSYYERHGGAVVSLAISTFATATISERSSGLDLASTEDNVRELVTAETYPRRMRYPFLAREFVTLQKAVAWHFGLDRARVVVSSELPGGGGLGASGAICSALVAAAADYLGERMDRWSLAATAARIEMAILRRPTGKHDPYASTFGGVNLFEFLRDGSVTVESVSMPPGVRERLEQHLVLFSDGSRRNAAGPLGELARRITVDKNTVLALSEMRETAHLACAAIERGDMATLGGLVDRGWRAKRRLHSQVSSPAIDRMIAIGRDAGAMGGKLCGAGLTGALLFVCVPEARDDVVRAMATQGWRRHPLAIDDAGATLTEPGETAATRSV